MKTILARSISLVAACVLGSNTSFAQNAAPGVACVVTISSPTPGQTVGSDGDVVGTATIPPGQYLWILAHRTGLQKWWPESGGAASVNSGPWQAAVTYGEPRDIGHDFEVAAIVVESNENARLVAWVEKADQTGAYPPVSFPAVTGACPVTRVTVRKTE